VGAAALRRGFPRTYRFAQARSVFAVADSRCEEILASPGSVTLWRLPEVVEEAFDSRWERWIDTASQWEAFFEALESLSGSDLVGTLRDLELVQDDDLNRYNK